MVKLKGMAGGLQESSMVGLEFQKGCFVCRVDGGMMEQEESRWFYRSAGNKS